MRRGGAALRGLCDEMSVEGNCSRSKEFCGGVTDAVLIPGYAAIVVARHPLGVLLPGWFYFNYIYGLATVGIRPVVLLSGNLAGNAALLDEIRQRAGAAKQLSK